MGIADRTATIRNCRSIGGSIDPAGFDVEEVADSEAVETSFSEERHRLAQPLIGPLLLFGAIHPPRRRRNGREEAICIPFTNESIIMAVFYEFTGAAVGPQESV
jgi:hypothetical protein